MASVQEHGDKVGVAWLCRALGLARATLYRRLGPKTLKPSPRPTNANALSQTERNSVMDLLHEERFVDRSPAQIVAALLDEGRYLCSTRTMYRILEEKGEAKERRNQLKHPHYEKPELLATRPNEVWSWDITKLKGPEKWTYYHLYVILDIFSRYVVGWMVAERESADLAKHLIKETCLKQEILPQRLTLHADRGSSMKSKPVALLLADLGVTKTHSRPHVSNDNPFSESHFKTLKYRPEFPKRFESLQAARKFCTEFFPWYNRQHYHSALASLPPEAVHYGQAQQILKKRQKILDEAYTKHPERFRKKPPKVPKLPKAVWINPPKTQTQEQEETTQPMLPN